MLFSFIFFDAKLLIKFLYLGFTNLCFLIDNMTNLFNLIVTLSISVRLLEL